MKPEFTRTRRATIAKSMPKTFNINPGTRAEQIYNFLKTGPKTWKEISELVLDIHKVPIDILIRNAHQAVKNQKSFKAESKRKLEELQAMKTDKKYFEKYPYLKGTPDYSLKLDISRHQQWIKDHEKNIRNLNKFLKDHTITKQMEKTLYSSYWSFNAQITLDKLRYFGYATKVSKGLYAIKTYIL